MKRAALIVTDARYVDGVTRRTGGGNDAVEHLWLEASEQLLADLRSALYALELWVTEPDPPGGIPRDDGGAAERLRQALGDS